MWRATAALLQIQTMDVNYQRDEVANLLYSLNYRQGARILEQNPPKPSEVAIGPGFSSILP
jgi:hypothetical protein